LKKPAARRAILLRKLSERVLKRCGERGPGHSSRASSFHRHDARL
jgi:hypothetical protein